MGLFLRILAIPNHRAVARTIALQEWEHRVVVANLNQLGTLFEARRIAQKNLQDSRRSSNNYSYYQQNYRRCQQAIVNQSVGIENLWRDLVHLYCADKVGQAWLPRAAAQIMLDGYAFELLDGEASGIPNEWLTEVVQELNRILNERHGRDVKVLSLGVLGEQSRDKSTLMNVAFGTRMRTSVGQCTRGVYFQLVKCVGLEEQDNSPDYLLLLDIEGIRLPEYDGLDDSNALDNKLAAMAVLPADACLFACDEWREY
jgi:hypothetical protein